MLELFKDSKHRDTFVGLVEKDYKSFNLNHLTPETIHRDNLKVNLPHFIFGNVADLFYIYLEAVNADDKASEESKID